MENAEWKQGFPVRDMTRFRDYPKVSDPDLMNRLREVEGSDYCPCETAAMDTNSDKTAAEAYDEWAADVRKYESKDVANFLLSRDSQSPVRIYGWHGWNRYLVAGDGTVAFSTGHTRRPEVVERARIAGFLIK